MPFFLLSFKNRSRNRNRIWNARADASAFETSCRKFNRTDEQRLKEESRDQMLFLFGKISYIGVSLCVCVCACLNACARVCMRRLSVAIDYVFLCQFRFCTRLLSLSHRRRGAFLVLLSVQRTRPARLFLKYILKEYVCAPHTQTHTHTLTKLPQSFTATMYAQFSNSQIFNNIAVYIHVVLCVTIIWLPNFRQFVL